MSYNPILIANKIIEGFQKEHKKSSMTIMQLLKLEYIAHGFSLGILDKPLIDATIEAWPHGPVIPIVYNTFRHSQGIHISKPMKIDDNLNKEIDEDTSGVIHGVIRGYGKKDGWSLSLITHAPKSPWTETVSEGGFYSEITNDKIKNYYAEKTRKYNQGKAA